MPGSKPRARPSKPATVVIAVTMSTMSMGTLGCTAWGAGGSASSPRPAPTGARTAKRLESALLVRVAGFTAFGRPESGALGELKSVRQGAQLQRATTYDKPRCAKANQAFTDDPRVRTAPAASVAFAQAPELTAHQLLLAIPADVAAAQIGYRVPESCRRYRARVGEDGEWFRYRVVERGKPAAGLGEKSRTVGVAARAGSGEDTAETKIWHVAFQGDGYVGSITLSGPRATRAGAEELARTAFKEADQALR
jgi:hypothetical protein